MPFDNPYFPQSFDVGTVGGPHTHIDSSGVQVINGTQKIVLAPSSIFNPNAVAINFYTGDAAEAEPGFVYEILDVGYWVGQAGNGGDSFRLTLFDSSFAAGPQGAISLHSGSRNGIRGSAATITATDHLNGNPSTILVDGDSQTIQFGLGLAPFNNIGSFNGTLFVSVGIGNETLQFYTQAGGVAKELFEVSNHSGATQLLAWNGQVLNVQGSVSIQDVATGATSNSQLGSLGATSGYMWLRKGGAFPGGSQGAYFRVDAGGNVWVTTPAGNDRQIAAGP